MYEHTKLFIDGAWTTPAGTGVIEVENPFTTEIIGHVPEGTNADMDAAVAAARRAFDDGPWSRMEPTERAEFVSLLSKNIQGRMNEYAELITAENGCPMKFTPMGQVFASSMVLDYYAELAGTYAWEDERHGLSTSIVRREPVGVVAAITPWNVPLFTALLKVAPALIAGCTMVLKPAPETPLTSQYLAQLLLEIGLPEGVVNVVPAGREVGQYLVDHPGIDKVSFTGSTAAGRQIAASCGAQLKRFTLELGGKSAAILLPDVDLEDALNYVVPAGIMNNGQACLAQTRILAPQSRYAEVTEALAARMAALTVGDPMDPTIDIGPLISERQRDRVQGYIAAGREAGATVATGGGRGDQDTGWFVEPTLFTDVTNDMTIAHEEIFGPVLVAIPYADEADAVRIANDSDYGLFGSVFGADEDHCFDIARQVRTGSVSVNGFLMEMGSPFGGYKNSGMGRELGPEGLEAYVEHKTMLKATGFAPM